MWKSGTGKKRQVDCKARKFWGPPPHRHPQRCAVWYYCCWQMCTYIIRSVIAVGLPKRTPTSSSCLKCGAGWGVPCPSERNHGRSKQDHGIPKSVNFLTTMLCYLFLLQLLQLLVYINNQTKRHSQLPMHCTCMIYEYILVYIYTHMPMMICYSVHRR